MEDATRAPPQQLMGRCAQGSRQGTRDGEAEHSVRILGLQSERRKILKVRKFQEWKRNMSRVLLRSV
jgi:hypothetical protein